MQKRQRSWHARKVWLLLWSGLLVGQLWSQIVIKYLSDSGEQRTPLAFVIREAKELASTLPGIVFKHVRREQNVVAHELVLEITAV